MGGRNTLQGTVYNLQNSTIRDLFQSMRGYARYEKGKNLTTEYTEFHGGGMDVVTELVEVTL